MLLLDLMGPLVEGFSNHAELLDSWKRARAACYGAGVPVIYVRVAFRPGHPEVDLGNALFGPIASAGRLVEGSPGAEVHAQISPGERDITIVKKRVSPFWGSDLDVILRTLGRRTLAVAGLKTSGVVLSTVLEGTDRDYRVVVLSDACADDDEALHRTLMEQLFPQRAVVVHTDAWVASLR